MQYLLLSTAAKVDEADASWAVNGVGRSVSHKYGYGLVDAYAAVVAARNYSAYLAVPLGRYNTAAKVIDLLAELNHNT